MIQLDALLKEHKWTWTILSGVYFVGAVTSITIQEISSVQNSGENNANSVIWTLIFKNEMTDSVLS